MIDLFKGLGVRVKFKDENGFQYVRETLERIGIESRKDKILYPSCHVLHKQGEYAIMHFKELFEMDGRESTITDGDLARRNKIISLLDEWELITIIDDDFQDMPISSMATIKVIPSSQKSEWKIEPKYQIGNKRKKAA